MRRHLSVALCGARLLIRHLRSGERDSALTGFKAIAARARHQPGNAPEPPAQLRPG